MNPKTIAKASKALREHRCKFLARIMLIGNKYNQRIVSPEEEEWHGLNLLERDDELSPSLFQKYRAK